MDDQSYSDAELDRYFRDRDARHASEGDGTAAVPPAVTPAIGSNSKPPGPPLSRESDVSQRVAKVFKGLAVGAGVFAILVAVWLLWLSRDLPSFEQIENPRNLLATVVFSADSVEIARYYDGENRTWVPLSEISEHVVNALISTEDRDFHSHWGVHMRRTLQAPFLTLAGKAQGGSTVSQQLARNLYREVGFERSVTRKIKEILTAIRIERAYTKDEILEAYLNTVPFRYNAFGIESAAKTYFNSTAAELNPEQSATLIGMLAANTYYDPKRNPENSMRRRNVVLSNMVAVGVLDESYYAQVRDVPIELEFEPYSFESNPAPHFAEYLRQWFTKWCEQNGYDPYGDGLIIHTTIDSRMQTLATEALETQMLGLQAVVDIEWSRAGGYSLGSTTAPYLRRSNQGGVDAFAYWWQRYANVVDVFVAETEDFRLLRESGQSRDEAVAQLRANEVFMDSLRTAKTRLESGLIAMDPHTGQVRAWVGGRDFVADKFDHVAQARRQPGSTFKPFAYTAAFDNGYSPSYHVLDAPFTWQGWRPRNSGGTSGGYVSLQQGLAYSKNIVAARVTQLVGPAEVARYAQRLGIRSPLDVTPYDPNDTPVYPNSIALGVMDVSLYEMASAYSTLADGGIYHEPSFVARIEDRYGNTVVEFTPTGREVLNPSTAYTTVNVMRDVVRLGTARSLRGSFDIGNIDLAGKTGTTQESADGWFMSMHPDLVVGSWVGFNDRQIKFRSSYWGQGAHTGMLVVGEFLERLDNDAPESLRLASDHRFEEPEDYKPPSRRGYASGGGDSGVRRRRGTQSDGTGGDRPARDLLDRWRQRESSQGESGGGESGAEGGDAGRIGW